MEDAILEPPKRPSVSGAEWVLTAELQRDGVVLERSASPLRIGDSWFNDRFVTKGDSPCGPKGSRNGRFDEAGRNIARWVDDMAQKRSRAEAAAKRASKPRGRSTK